MAFKKQFKQQRNNDADGRISLWTPDEDKKYVISGIVDIDGVSYRVFIYENDAKQKPNSPDYYGSLYLDEERPRYNDRGSNRNNRDDDDTQPTRKGVPF